jgi:hypothetical protein
MPYLAESRRNELDNNQFIDLTFGDLNYLITKRIIEVWKASPRYATIHEIQKATRVPSTDGKLWDLRSQLSDEYKISLLDFDVAAELAFQEFYSRVGILYEETKAVQNGDLYEEIVDEILSVNNR